MKLTPSSAKCTFSFSFSTATTSVEGDLSLCLPNQSNNLSANHFAPIWFFFFYFLCCCQLPSHCLIAARFQTNPTCHHQKALHSFLCKSQLDNGSVSSGCSCWRLSSVSSFDSDVRSFAPGFVFAVHQFHQTSNTNAAPKRNECLWHFIFILERQTDQKDSVWLKAKEW